MLIRSFAKVGLVSLIDEATGYQRYKNNDALRILVNQYIEKELQKWTRMFPEHFFYQLDMLYKHKTSDRKRPQYYGKFISKYVYDPIENGYVKKELDTVTIKDDGTRKAKFHQWLTDHGKQILTLQLGKIIATMQVSDNIVHCKRLLARQQDGYIPDIIDRIEQMH